MKNWLFTKFLLLMADKKVIIDVLLKFMKNLWEHIVYIQY